MARSGLPSPGAAAGIQPLWGAAGQTWGPRCAGSSLHGGRGRASVDAPLRGKADTVVPALYPPGGGPVLQQPPHSWSGHPWLHRIGSTSRPQPPPPPPPHQPGGDQGSEVMGQCPSCPWPSRSSAHLLWPQHPATPRPLGHTAQHLLRGEGERMRHSRKSAAP